MLTRPGAAQATRAELVFPRDLGFLVLADDERGVVLGEVAAHDRGRSLSLRPGRYFLRGRGPDFLLEGSVSASAGQTRVIDTASLRHVAYARLVRKGEGGGVPAQAVELGVAARSLLPNAGTPCWGALVGYRVDFASFGLGGRFGACQSQFRNTAVDDRTDEYSLTFLIDHAWDWPSLSLLAGAGFGGVLTHQHFTTDGNAPSRSALSSLGFVSAGAFFPIGRFYFGGDVRSEGQLARFQSTALDDPELRIFFALRGSLLGGLQF